MFEARMTMVCKEQQTEGFRLIAFPLFFLPKCQSGFEDIFYFKERRYLCMNVKNRRTGIWRKQANVYRNQCKLPQKMNVLYQRNILFSRKTGIPRKTRKGA